MSELASMCHFRLGTLLFHLRLRLVLRNGVEIFSSGTLGVERARQHRLERIGLCLPRLVLWLVALSVLTSFIVEFVRLSSCLDRPFEAPWRQDEFVRGLV